MQIKYDQIKGMQLRIEQLHVNPQLSDFNKEAKELNSFLCFAIILQQSKISVRLQTL